MTELDLTTALQASERLSSGLTAEYLEHHALMPLMRRDGKILAATWAEAVDERALDDIRLLAGVPVELVRLPEPEVRAAIRRVYSSDDLTAEGVVAGMAEEIRPGGEMDSALDDLVMLANEAPVVKLVNLLLLEALDARASDVHLESYPGGLRVRYRIDGVLQDAVAPPKRLAAAVVSRLKIMAELDIAERRIPQDGRIRLRMHDRQVDVRVSTLPALHGESVVLRLLDKEAGRIDLEELGMAGDTLTRLLRHHLTSPTASSCPRGPRARGRPRPSTLPWTGSERGKEKIITVEDPVEYELPGSPPGAGEREGGPDFRQAPSGPFSGRTPTSCWWGRSGTRRRRTSPPTPRSRGTWSSPRSTPMMRPRP